MRKAIVSISVFGAITFASLGAQAATWPAKNRCNDAARTMRSSATMYDVRKDIDPLAVDNAKGHLRQILENWRYAQSQLKQIPEGQFDKSDPELKECVDELGKWETYIKTMEKKIQVAEAQAKMIIPFLEEVKPHEKPFLRMLAIALGSKGDALNGMAIADARKVMESLASVEKSCAQRVPEAGNQPPTNSGEPGGSVQNSGGTTIHMSATKLPNNWCYVAKHRNELMTKSLNQHPFNVEGYGNYVLLMPETMKTLEAGRTDMEPYMAAIVLRPAEFIGQVKKVASEWYTALACTMPSDRFAALEADVQSMVSKVDEVAPTIRFEGKGPHAANIEAGAARSIKKIFPAATVKKSVMDADGWTISKNAFDIPTDRYRSGHILYKTTGQWCQQRIFNVSEPYAGGGRYQAFTSVNILGGVRFLRCD